MQALTCVTAQHRQMLDQVLNLFGIVPDHDLDLMQAGQSPCQVAAAVLSRLEPILAQERPDWVLVQGDTTTVAAAALAAYYARVRVGHVEAGLRTHDPLAPERHGDFAGTGDYRKWQPFPEEINRRVAGVIADLHFAPTEGARRNLLREGTPDDTIRVTGNPVIDALHWVAARPPTPEAQALLDELDATQHKLILVTAHRRENFGHPLEDICLALRDIALRCNGQVRIVYPVHLNPNVWRPVHERLDGVPGIRLIPPLDYLPLVHLMKHAWLALTDSGGIQEEAPGLGVPVLVLRRVTERPEAVEAGAARLVGTETTAIVGEAFRLLDDGQAYAEMAQAVNPYGDGHAAERIVDAVVGTAPK